MAPKVNVGRAKSVTRARYRASGAPSQADVADPSGYDEEGPLIYENPPPPTHPRLL